LKNITWRSGLHRAFPASGKKTVTMASPKSFLFIAFRHYPCNTLTSFTVEYFRGYSQIQSSLPASHLVRDSFVNRREFLMNMHLLDHFSADAPNDAVFSALRCKIASEVRGCAGLLDLLECVNQMHRSHARPEEFQQRFDHFVSRSAEYHDLFSSFFPALTAFLPQSGMGARSDAGTGYREADAA
jgi:hypothetical protein